MKFVWISVLTIGGWVFMAAAEPFLDAGDLAYLRDLTAADPHGLLLAEADQIRPRKLTDGRSLAAVSRRTAWGWRFSRRR